MNLENIYFLGEHHAQKVLIVLPIVKGGADG